MLETLTKQRTWTERYTDPDEMAAAIVARGTILPVCRGGFSSMFSNVRLAPDLLLREASLSSMILFRASVKMEAVFFNFPVNAAGSVSFDGVDAQRDVLAMRRRGEEITLRSFGRMNCLVVVTTSAALEDAAVTLLGEMPRRLHVASAHLQGSTAAPALRVAELHRAAIKTALSAAPDGSDARMLGCLRDGILTALIEAAEDGRGVTDTTRRGRRGRELALIEDWLETHADVPVSLLELCRSTGLHYRTVERVVRERTGLSALDYLRRRRLASVRRALLHPAPGDSVTTVAMSFGFTHLGRLAGDFRAIYGETPSAVLARGQALVGLAAWNQARQRGAHPSGPLVLREVPDADLLGLGPLARERHKIGEAT